MFRKFLILSLIPTLIFSLETSKLYKFSAPRVNGDMISLPGCHSTYQDFAPRLPLKPVTLRLPLGEEAISFKVEYGNPIELEGIHYIGPFRPGGRITQPPPEDYYTRASSVYTVDAFYPAEVKSPKFFTHFRYGHPIFITSIRPVQYNPVSGKIKYFNEIKVTVVTAKKRGPLPLVKFSPFIKSQLQLEIDNPEVVEGIPYTKKDGDDYEYALITTNALKDSWGDFVDFNTDRCLRTKIETIETINASGQGNTSADKLKNYLIKEYEDHNILYVMLGGDDEINQYNQIQPQAITHKGYTSEFKDYGTDYIKDADIAADMFYETLDGQELEDLEWELYAARIPADNATELKNMIDKIIKYSTEPVTSALQTSVLAGEKLWANINGGTCWGIDCMNLLKGTCTKYYTTTGFDNTWTQKELKEKNSNWAKNTLSTYMNDGIHFVNHLGHSNNFMIMKFYQDDVLALRNSAYFIGFTEGCYCGSWDNRKISFNATFTTGHYSQDCIAEDFTVGTKYAAVAFISNTRFGLGDNGKASQEGNDGSSIRYQRFFHDALFGQKMHHIGVMLAYAKWINKQEILKTDINSQSYFGQMEYCAYQVNCLGDPALSVWTKAPETLNPTLPNEIATTTFVLETGHPYTWVALGKSDGSIVTTQYSGEDGKINITDDVLKTYIEDNPGGQLKVRIKAHNYLPFEKDIKIVGTGIGNEELAFNFFKTSFNNTNAMVNLHYTIPEKALVAISLYNSRGALLKTVVKEYQSPGHYSKTFNIGNLGNGIYYCKMQINDAQCARKFIITK